MAAALFSAALLVVAVPAVASAACPSTHSERLLEKLGDNAEYFLLTGSSFESGASDWSLSGAEIVSGGANGGSQSLVLQSGGIVLSPTFCVSSEYPSFRLFARQISGGGWFSGLKVNLRWTDDWGFPHETNIASLKPGNSWELSPVLRLATALPLWMRGSTLNVRLVFQPYGGTWAITDVLIDPYRR
jgi:hypothetical protein